MGFIRRGNYAENTPDEIVEDVKSCLKSKIEGMSFVNHYKEFNFPQNQQSNVEKTTQAREKRAEKF